MAIWLVIAFIIVVLLYFLVGRRSYTEGFGEFLDTQKAFADRQNVYFNTTAEKGILTNPGLSLAGLNEAVAQPDYYLPVNTFEDATKYFMEDPENAWTEKDNSMCRGAKHPRELPPLGVADRVGCGWYFMEDEGSESIGAIGTRAGPAMPQKLPAGGTWIWSRATAEKMEDMKFCKSIKSCEFVDLEDVRGVCAFCAEKGHAIPITSNGSPKYPDDAEGSCGSALLRRGADCKKSAVPDIPAGNGRACGGKGFPSPDGSQRLYTIEECNELGGKLMEGGLCIRPEDGGSYSVECAGLNVPVTSAVGCSTSGKLNRTCALEIATKNGFSGKGGLVGLINGVPRTGMLEDALRTLRENGTNVPDADIVSGNIDASTLNGLLKNLVAISRRSGGEAAKYMIDGTPFNPCGSYKADQTGPFKVDCLQRAFRKAGCQAGGAKYPNERSAVAELANVTWSQANAMFKKTFEDMKSTDPTTQDMALKNCLGSGAEFYRERKNTCWKCENGIHTPIRRNTSGEIECASTDGYTCLWHANKAACDATITRLPSMKLNNLSCGADHARKYGSDGYSTASHWCARANSGGKHNGPFSET